MSGTIRGHRGLWTALIVLGIGAVVGGLYWGWMHLRTFADSQVDWEAVHAQNNHAIAIMEGYHYVEAIAEFDKVVKMAPDWLPGRINLGIAQLNASGSEEKWIAPCKATFEEVLRRDADNPHAHFGLGILLKYNEDGKEAIRHFEAVLKKVPNDAHTLYWLGHLKTPGSEEQSEYFRKALKQNRHLTGAIYGLSQNLRLNDPKEAQKLSDELEALKRSDWENPAEIKYSRMGPLAEVIGGTNDPPSGPRIGPLPLFERREGYKVQLPPGVRWAKASDFGNEAVGEVRRLVRARFGAVMVVLDYNCDRKPDLFLAGAVVEKGKVRDLLLRNEGFGHFTDVTSEAGLAEPRPTLGCVVADVDNDGKPDVLLTGAGVQKLFRNTGKGTFEDVSAQAMLDKVASVCLGAACVDLDQDSDLDLLLCAFARDAADAVKILKGEKVKPSGELLVYLHVGEAPEAQEPTRPAPPLECKFTKVSLAALQGPAAPVVAVAASDRDGDRDLDFLVLANEFEPALVTNDRLLKFRPFHLPEALLKPARWNGALVLDVNHDGRSDLVLLSADARPRVLLNRAPSGESPPAEWFEVAETDAPRLRQAMAVDLNLDSWTDVMGLSSDGLPVLLVNEGGKLAVRAEALGRDADWPRDLLGMTLCPVRGDGPPDLFVWSEEKGLQLYDNRGNGGNGVQIELVGRNSKDGQNRLRCNADGIGAWVVALAGNVWAGQEYTTLSAGLGQSRQPLLFGIARQPRIEALRIRWPDGTMQGEPDINDPNSPNDLRAGKRHAILQRNRMPGSCPILFAWNGQRFGFVNDFLGAGSIGETGSDGRCRPPRAEESIAIEAEQLAPRDGKYILKITEPMDETTYLDRLQLVVVDRPPGVRVYPEERFVTTGPQPSQQLVAFDKEIYPVAARDHRGRDVTQTLRRWDRLAVDDFARRAWVGFAEEHAIELDFGDRLASFGAKDRLYLCLAGWTEYPFPESSWAAHQAGIHEQWPILERQDESGQWRSLGESGFPAGMPRTMLVDVTGKVSGPRCRLRLRTNMHICWDQAFVAAECRSGELRATCLEVQTATLAQGYIPAEHSPDGRLPKGYDYHRVDNVSLVGQSGRMTRFGDVTELLHQRDDRFVIFGPGDDLTVYFDAGTLPPLPPGWKRSFVLRTAGYCKDTALSTAHGDTVEPLPFAAMRNYPYGPQQNYPEDALHQEYRRRYLTREVQANPWPRR